LCKNAHKSDFIHYVFALKWYFTPTFTVRLHDLPLDGKFAQKAGFYLLSVSLTEGNSKSHSKIMKPIALFCIK